MKEGGREGEREITPPQLKLNRLRFALSISVATRRRVASAALSRFPTFRRRRLFLARARRAWRPSVSRPRPSSSAMQCNPDPAMLSCLVRGRGFSEAEGRKNEKLRPPTNGGNNGLW